MAMCHFRILWGCDQRRNRLWNPLLQGLAFMTAAIFDVSGKIEGKGFDE